MVYNEDRAATIARVMSTCGFTPRGEIDATKVEYYKDYSEPGGRIARCTVAFNKGGVLANLDHAKIMRFTVTVQGEVDPVMEEINGKAPVVMRPDMLHVLRTLDGIGDGPMRELHVCSTCHAKTEEFILTESGRIVCPKCITSAINAEGPKQR